jgi:CheY-like chemotaxis protein
VSGERRFEALLAHTATRTDSLGDQFTFQPILFALRAVGRIKERTLTVATRGGVSPIQRRNRHKSLPPRFDLEPQDNHSLANGQEKFSVRASRHKEVNFRLRYAESMAIVLLASDLAALRKDLRATLEGPDLVIEEVASGPEVIARVEQGGVDLVVVDLQIGTMGGMAICMELRHEESYGAAEPVAVLMLLDRRPDVFLARRSGAEGFLVKPLDPQRVRSAVRALLRGEEYEDDSLRPATVRVGSADVQ